MYKQGERIDYIVIPIPNDLGMNSKLKKVISVSPNVHRLLKRNNLITVRDLVEIDYEEIATFRASVSQKTIIHGAKQELEEYLSDEVYEKEHEYVGKEPETVIPDEAIAEVNKILKDDYSERIHAYKREDIWRCRYSRIELEVTRIQDADSSLGLFLSGLDTLKAGFDMANVCPVDKMLCTRSWLVRLLRVMIDNPIFDQNLRKETLDAERNEIVEHSIGAFSEICKWSKQVPPYSEHDKYQNLAETLSSVVYDFVAEHFAPRKNEFGMILSPRDNMRDAVRGALFPGGENPRRFGLFERMAEVCFVVPFLQKPRRPSVLKKNMPYEVILDAANRASKLKAYMETRRDIARFKQYNFASRRVEDDLKHHLLDSLFGCGDTKYLDMLRIAYEVNPYATWEENGCRKQELLDRDVLQSKTDVHEWLVEGMGSHQSSFPIHRFTTNDLYRTIHYPSYCRFGDESSPWVLKGDQFDLFMAELREAYESDCREEETVLLEAEESRKRRHEKCCRVAECACSAARSIRELVCRGCFAPGRTIVKMEPSVVDVNLRLVSALKRDSVKCCLERISTEGMVRHEFLMPDLAPMFMAMLPFTEEEFKNEVSAMSIFMPDDDRKMIEDSRSEFMMIWELFSHALAEKMGSCKSIVGAQQAISDMLGYYRERTDWNEHHNLKDYSKAYERLKKHMVGLAETAASQERKAKEGKPRRVKSNEASSREIAKAVKEELAPDLREAKGERARIAKQVGNTNRNTLRVLSVAMGTETKVDVMIDEGGYELPDHDEPTVFVCKYAGIEKQMLEEAYELVDSGKKNRSAAAKHVFKRYVNNNAGFSSESVFVSTFYRYYARRSKAEGKDKTLS